MAILSRSNHHIAGLSAIYRIFHANSRVGALNIGGDRMILSEFSSEF